MGSWELGVPSLAWADARSRDGPSVGKSPPFRVLGHQVTPGRHRPVPRFFPTRRQGARTFKSAGGPRWAGGKAIRKKAVARHRLPVYQQRSRLFWNLPLHDPSKVQRISKFQLPFLPCSGPEHFLVFPRFFRSYETWIGLDWTGRGEWSQWWYGQCAQGKCETCDKTRGF